MGLTKKSAVAGAGGDVKEEKASGRWGVMDGEPSPESIEVLPDPNARSSSGRLQEQGMWAARRQ
jgi:hypothetical protein